MPTHQDSLEQGKSGLVTELFPYAMPFRASQVIGLFVILIAAVVAAAAVMVDIPETVRAPFVLLPETGANPIQAPMDGRLESVFAQTQGVVEAGELLFTIRSPRVQELSADRRGVDKALSAVKQERASEENAFQINRNIQVAEINQREKEVTYRKKHLSVYKDVLDKMEALGAQGLASSVDLLSHRLGHAEADRDMALAEESAKAARLALERIDAEHQQKIDRFDHEAEQLQLQRDALDALLRDVAGDLLEVRAPYRGAIISVARKQPGDVVAVGTELCQIASLDVPARAYLDIAERGMALLKEGQEAKLLFEAYPYQRYGTVDGSLSWLSPAPVTTRDAEHFVAHVRLARQHIGPDSKPLPLRAGMRGEARIQVGRRTLIEFAFDPLRKLRENMRDQQAGD